MAGTEAREGRQPLPSMGYGFILSEDGRRFEVQTRTTAFIKKAATTLSKGPFTDNAWNVMFPQGSPVGFSRENENSEYSVGFFQVAKRLITFPKKPPLQVDEERFDAVLTYLAAGMVMNVIQQEQMQKPKDGTVVYRIAQPVLDLWASETPPMTPKTQGYSERVREYLAVQSTQVEQDQPPKQSSGLSQQVNNLQRGLFEYAQEHNLFDITEALDQIALLATNRVHSIREGKLMRRGSETANHLDTIRKFIATKEEQASS